MTQLLVWACVVLGVVYVITHSVIFMPVRMWLAKKSVWLDVLLYCPMCVSFWVGLFYADSPLPLDESFWLVERIHDGIAAVGLTWVVTSLVAPQHPSYDLEHAEPEHSSDSEKA